MKCLVTTLVLMTVLKVNAVTQNKDKWMPMENKHQISRRRADGNGAYSAPADDSIDLHNKEFCVDVSTYQPVVWVEKDGEECKTEFVKQCEERSEEVCAEVHETRCEVKCDT